MPTPRPDTDSQRKILNRLKRAQGQLNGVIAKVEAGAPCRDVVTQLAAVSSALDKAGYMVISSALRDCLISDDPEADMTPDDLEKLFLTLS
ncbi:MAG: metal-sensitive transcriptional regulator [Arachnia sp.]